MNWVTRWDNWRVKAVKKLDDRKCKDPAQFAAELVEDLDRRLKS